VPGTKHAFKQRVCGTAGEEAEGLLSPLWCLQLSVISPGSLHFCSAVHKEISKSSLTGDWGDPALPVGTGTAEAVGCVVVPIARSGYGSTVAHGQELVGHSWGC